MGLDAEFLIIGHRGAAGLEPENTLRSFARAVALGVNAVELDVHFVDDRLVVIHDDTLERTTSGRGPVMRTSFAALRQLDAGAGEKIPTLDEIFDLIPSGVAINVELKGSGTAAPVAHFIRAHRDAEVLVSSFAHAELHEFRRHSPETPVAPLFGRASTQMLDIARELHAWSINLSKRLATPNLLDEIALAGYRALVYTVNDFALAQQLRNGGANGIFTDFPDRMLELSSSTVVE